MSKYKSKTGLPEALGSGAHLPAPRPYGGSKPTPMCDIPNCRTRRGERVRLSAGGHEYVMQQGFGDVVIKGHDGGVRGYVCQQHYVEMIEAAGKDQLSQTRNPVTESPAERWDIGYDD